MAVHAAELYPTVGPLLVQLCRNPVVMASEPLADLVVQAVFRFSSKSGAKGAASASARSAGKSTAKSIARMAPSAEQSWRAARQQGRHGKSIAAAGSNQQRAYSGPNGSRKARDPFQDLFLVSDKEMKGREVELTLETMADTLKTLQGQVLNTELTEAAWISLVTWNRELSELCAPLMSTSNAEELVGGIIRTAYLLHSERPRVMSRASYPLLMDSSFVELLMALRDGVTMPTVFRDSRTLAQLLVVAPLARQSCLIQLIDTIIQDCRRLPDFFQSRRQISRQHFDSSHFLTSALSAHVQNGQHCDLVERLLEDSAELAGEIDDWRIVRIWTLFVEWILTPLGSEGARARDTLEIDADMSAMDRDMDLGAMVLSACRIVNDRDFKRAASRGVHFSDSSAVLSEINHLLEIQKRYVFESAPPREMALRRRLAFLIASAVISSNGLLVSLIHQYFLSLDVSNRDKQDPTTPSEESTLLNLLSMLLSGQVDSGTTVTMSAITAPLKEFLKDLHGTLRVSETSNPYDLRLGTVSDLERIFVRFLPILRMNAVVTAEIVCAIVVYSDSEDSAFWQSVINAALRSIAGSESTPLLKSLPAFMARLQDLSETMSVPGLVTALDALLSASSTLPVVNTSMDMSQ
ncbi:hypothetical protein BGX29_008002 [Mortierella sp. GBA35]|nr:hypothetical protein BGX29_008002 [Mortierella sp. GBA35]